VVAAARRKQSSGTSGGGPGQSRMFVTARCRVWCSCSSCYCWG
jgi:hypothetical protein